MVVVSLVVAERGGSVVRKSSLGIISQRRRAVMERQFGQKAAGNMVTCYARVSLRDRRFQKEWRKQKDLKTTCHCMSKDLSCGTPERKRGDIVLLKISSLVLTGSVL